MFAIGMPHHLANLFSAASMLVAIPAGIQVVAWLVTLRRGQMQRAAPTWFILGFFGIFVLGGLTGVMVAVVPYDWQVHDTYFVVAHLHYVLLGGLVFPMFAAIYYWAPMVSGRMLSERLGAMGLRAHVRRREPHVLSDAHCGPARHAAAGLDLPARPRLGASEPARLRSARPCSRAASASPSSTSCGACGSPRASTSIRGTRRRWNGCRSTTYGTRSIPRIESREPLWDNPGLRQEVDTGQHYLPGLVTGTRETIVTSPRSARPEYILRLPGPSWLPFVAGVGTAAFFFLLTLKFFVAAGLAAAITLFGILRWAWASDPAPGGELHDIGDGIRLPDAMTGPRSHAWWAMIVLLIVDGAILASLLFGWFYLAAGAAEWPPAGGAAPAIGLSALAALGWVSGSAAIEYAGRQLRGESAGRSRA